MGQVEATLLSAHPAVRRRSDPDPASPTRTPTNATPDSSPTPSPTPDHRHFLHLHHHHHHHHHHHDAVSSSSTPPIAPRQLFQHTPPTRQHTNNNNALMRVTCVLNSAVCSARPPGPSPLPPRDNDESQFHRRMSSTTTPTTFRPSSSTRVPLHTHHTPLTLTTTQVSPSSGTNQPASPILCLSSLSHSPTPPSSSKPTAPAAASSSASSSSSSSSSSHRSSTRFVQREVRKSFLTLPAPAPPRPCHRRTWSSVAMSADPQLQFSDFSYPVTADGYHVVCEIGSGAFASVYKGYVKTTREAVAIKVLDLETFDVNPEDVRKEISMMLMLNHPNVVKIKCSFVDRHSLWIVMELLEAGSCLSIMKHHFPNGIKDEVAIATILREVALALQYFHKSGNIHRDVKAGNILMSANGSVQLADFGVAGTLMENGDRKKNRQTFTGTPCWMAPEVMEHTSGYDTKADIWSFGITALELAYGRAPYANYPPMRVIVLTLQEDPPSCECYDDPSYEFSKHFRSLVKKCLQKDPTKRPSATEVLASKFFKQAANTDYLRERIVSIVLGPSSASSSAAAAAAAAACSLSSSAADFTKPGLDLRALKKSKSMEGGMVGPWVFDEEEFLQQKRLSVSERTAQRKQASGGGGGLPHVGCGAGDFDDDDDDDFDNHNHLPNEAEANNFEQEAIQQQILLQQQQQQAYFQDGYADNAYFDSQQQQFQQSIPQQPFDGESTPAMYFDANGNELSMAEAQQAAAVAAAAAASASASAARSTSSSADKTPELYPDLLGSQKQIDLLHLDVNAILEQQQQQQNVNAYNSQADTRSSIEEATPTTGDSTSIETTPSAAPPSFLRVASQSSIPLPSSAIISSLASPSGNGVPLHRPDNPFAAILQNMTHASFTAAAAAAAATRPPPSTTTPTTTTTTVSPSHTTNIVSTPLSVDQLMNATSASLNSQSHTRVTSIIAPTVNTNVNTTAPHSSTSPTALTTTITPTEEGRQETMRLGRFQISDVS